MMEEDALEGLLYTRVTDEQALTLARIKRRLDRIARDVSVTSGSGFMGGVVYDFTLDLPEERTVASAFVTNKDGRLREYRIRLPSLVESMYPVRRAEGIADRIAEETDAPGGVTIRVEPPPKMPSPIHRGVMVHYEDEDAQEMSTDELLGWLDRLTQAVADEFFGGLTGEL